MTTIETDYLVVGAGATGMAFTDALIADSDADVVMVDRRHAPGGHWRNAYEFVRLHQPSPYYGVNSRVLGTDTIDETGPEAGSYGRATGREIVDYFDRVLDEVLLESDRVRFFGMSDYVGGENGRHRFVSCLTGQTTEVVVRRKLVDATYLETAVPSRHVPPFGVDADARLIAVNGLVDVAERADGFTIIGGGKTAMDACGWLLGQGVDPQMIRWIRPRDSWMLDRAYSQPLDLVTQLMEGLARNFEASAEADDVADLFARLEDSGQLVRLDPAVEPAMYRCASVSQHELGELRRIENVVRLGRVRQVGAESIELESGKVPTSRSQVHVDCTAAGLTVKPARPIFDGDLVTLQQIRTCQPTFNAAMVGFIEGLGIDDAGSNELCPPNPYPDAAVDWIASTAISAGAEAGWLAHPEVSAWMERSRLNAAKGIADHMDDPAMQSALGRWAANVEPAVANLQRLAAGLGTD